MTEELRPTPAHGHGGHGWMMIACCIPMLVIAVALVATGSAKPSFLFAAVLCTAMMAMMMRGMNHGRGKDVEYDQSQSKDLHDHHSQSS